MTYATTTIQISVHDWDTMEELIYEAQIGSIEDMVSLSYQFGSKVKYKKLTDLNWYTYREITKRLFKKEINENQIEVKLVDANDLNKIMEKRRHFKEYILKLQKEPLLNEIAKEEKLDFDEQTSHGFGLELDRREYEFTLQERSHINELWKQEKLHLDK